MRDAIVSGGRLRALRLQAELTLREFAELCGSNGRPMATSYIKYVEGGHCQPSDVNARKFARVLGCTVEDFSTPKEQASGSAA